MNNIYDVPMSSEMLKNYFGKKLVSGFYKLLPLMEGRDFRSKKVIYSDKEALKMFRSYLNNFIPELCGDYKLFNDSEYFITFLAHLEFMKSLENKDHEILKATVMKCIDICKKLEKGVDA